MIVTLLFFAMTSLNWSVCPKLQTENPFANRVALPGRIVGLWGKLPNSVCLNSIVLTKGREGRFQRQQSSTRENRCDVQVRINSCTYGLGIQGHS